jgi:hypothetical protein
MLGFLFRTHRRLQCTGLVLGRRKPLDIVVFCIHANVFWKTYVLRNVSRLNTSLFHMENRYYTAVLGKMAKPDDRVKSVGILPSAYISITSMIQHPIA